MAATAQTIKDHIDSILAAVSTAVYAKADSYPNLFLKDRPGRKLTYALQDAVRDAAGAENFDDLDDVLAP